MATSIIKDANQTLLHDRFLYSSSTPLVVTNGSQEIRSGTIKKVRSDTTLFFVFMCYGYVDSLSGGFYFFIDNQAVADATTIFTSTDSMVLGCRFVDGISAGSHTFKITASTQGNNTFTVPAWTNSVITIAEQY